MAKTITFDVNVDSKDSAKTLGSLRAELEKINEELEQTEVGSKAFNSLSDKARAAGSEIKTLEKTFEGLEPGQKAQAFVGAFETIAGASAVAAGTLQLFGVESEKFGKLEEKVQSTIAIAVGARSIAEGALQAKIAARLAIEKAVQVAAKAQIVVQTALNAVLNANPIGLIILGVGAAVLIFTKFGDKIMGFIKSALGPLNDALETAGKWLRMLGSAIGIVSSEEELAAEKSKKLSGQKIEQYDRELKLAKARGEDTIKIEQKIIQEKMKLYKKDSKEYKDLQTDLVALSAQREKEEASVREAAAKARSDEYKKQKDEAKKVQSEIANEAELIGLTEEAKAIELENRKYEARLAVLQKFHLDTSNLERLHQDEVSKIQTEAQTKRDNEKTAKDKEKTDAELKLAQDKEALILEIRGATAVTEKQQQQLELLELAEYYNQLILAAKDNELETQNLEDAKNVALGLKKDEFRAKDTESEKQYQKQIADLTIGAATNVISTLSSLNDLFAGESEASQKKAFKRNQALQLAQTIIDTFSSATGAFNSLVGIPVVGPVLGGVAAAAAVAAGLANVKKIKEQKFEGASASGGNTPTAGNQAGGGMIPSTGSITVPEGSRMTPNVPMNNNGGAIKTYVLAGDVSTGQEADRKIEQRRTL